MNTQEILEAVLAQIEKQQDYHSSYARLELQSTDLAARAAAVRKLSSIGLPCATYSYGDVVGLSVSYVNDRPHDVEGLIRDHLIQSFCPEAAGFNLGQGAPLHKLVDRDGVVHLPNYSRNNPPQSFQVEALIHELMHARQILTGKLVPRYNHAYYKGVRYNYSSEGSALRMPDRSRLFSTDIPYETAPLLTPKSWIKKNQAILKAYGVR